MMLGACQHPHLHHKAIYEKYCEKRFKEAAFVVQQEIDDGFTLPRIDTRRSLRDQPPYEAEPCAETFQAPTHSQILVSTEG